MATGERMREPHPVDLDQVKRFGAMGRQMGFAHAATMAEEIVAEITWLRALRTHHTASGTQTQ